MLPVQFQTTSTTLLPPHGNEAALCCDASSCLLGTSFAKNVPLQKNIHLLLDNSYSMNSSKAKVIELLKGYFNFLSDEAKYRPLQHYGSASLFDVECKAVPSAGIDFLENLLSVFDAKGYGTNLAPALSRAANDWLSKINPDEPYENLLILITDGANSDEKEVKDIKEAFISLLKTKNVALYIFGFDRIETAKSSIDNFTNFYDENPTAGVVDSTLKINYFFIDSDESIPVALQTLTGHRTVLKDAVVSLYNNNPLTNIRLVGFPNYPDCFPLRFPECRRTAYFLGSPQASDLKSLIISIRGGWSDSIGICIDGVDPATGHIVSSGLIQHPLPLHPEIHIDTFLAVLPKLAQEARKSKNIARQSEVLSMIKSMKTEIGDTPLLNENEKYLNNALKETPQTELDGLFDALNSLSIH